MPIRFHLDEHVSSAIAAGLRHRNIDVTTAADAGLIGAEDVSHLEFAFSSERVLVTQDVDFLRLHADGTPHAGIVYCQQRSRTIGETLRLLLLIHAALLPEEMANKGEFL